MPECMPAATDQAGSDVPSRFLSLASEASDSELGSWPMTPLLGAAYAASRELGTDPDDSGLLLYDRLAGELERRFSPHGLEVALDPAAPSLVAARASEVAAKHSEGRRGCVCRSL